MFLKVKRYIDRNPISTMAFWLFAGDMGFLGYAFYSARGMSYLRLAGAVAALFGQFILLARDNKRSQDRANECGPMAIAVELLRRLGLFLTDGLPLVGKTSKNPIFWGFFLLTFNACMILIDGIDATLAHLDPMIRNFYTNASQTLWAALAVGGAGSFMLASSEVIKTQRVCNFLTELGPKLFWGAFCVNFVFSATSLNPFVMTWTVCFAVANYASQFIKFDKAYYTPEI